MRLQPSAGFPPFSSAPAHCEAVSAPSECFEYALRPSTGRWRCLFAWMEPRKRATPPGGGAAVPLWILSATVISRSPRLCSSLDQPPAFRHHFIRCRPTQSLWTLSGHPFLRSIAQSYTLKFEELPTLFHLIPLSKPLRGSSTAGIHVPAGSERKRAKQGCSFGFKGRNGSAGHRCTDRNAHPQLWAGGSRSECSLGPMGCRDRE